MKLLSTLILILFSLTIYAQDLEWAKSIGGSTADEGSCIKLDSYGNVYTSGIFQSTVDFDPGIGVNNHTAFPSGTDIFIQKLDSNGNFLWAHTIGGPGSDRPSSLAVDLFDNIYLTGRFQDSIDIDPGPGTTNMISKGGSDVFIQKIDPTGTILWTKYFGGSQSDEPIDINLDQTGNLFISGQFRDSVDFDPGISTHVLSSTGMNDAFLLKLDPNGNFNWVKSFSGPNDISGGSSHIDFNNNIYLTGLFNGTVDFDPQSSIDTLSSNGLQDIYILKLNSNGNLIWAKSFGGSGWDNGKSIITDSIGNIITTGYYENTVDFDPNIGTYNLVSNGNHDIYILKLDSTGNLIWAKSMGSTGTDYGIDINIDSYNNIYMMGMYSNTIDIDPGIGIYNLLSNGIVDCVLQKLNNNGIFIWAESFGNTGLDKPYSLETNSYGNIYMTGTFENTVDFEPGPNTFNLTSNASRDIFTLKLSQDLCSNFTVVIDSALNVSCLDSGYIFSHPIQGSPPFSYTWDTSPTVLDSNLVVLSSGIYTLTTTDGSNCINNTSVLINGPTSMTNFDLNTNLITANFRPGFSTSLFLDAFNDGCDTSSSQLTLILDPSTIYDSASVAPNIINGDTLIWYINPLIYDSTHFQPIIHVSTDVSAQIGDTVCFNIEITPIVGDINPNNNIKNYCFPVVNGYDPNDKQVYPQGECIDNYVLKNEPLTYTIRFQNTGNSEAINIHIIDSIANDLDITTTRVIGNSHQMYTEILQGNVLQFNFDSIMLPNSSTNQVGSNGYVIFEIYPNSGVTNGSIIENSSEIYFDFNPPVITNTVMNTLIDIIPSCIVGINEQLNTKDQIIIYPNPTNKYLNINSASTIKQIEIIDITGRIVLSNKKDKKIDVNSLNSGIYFIKVYSDNKTFSQKIIKE